MKIKYPPSYDQFDIEAEREGQSMKRSFKIQTPTRRKGRATNKISKPENANRKVA